MVSAPQAQGWKERKGRLGMGTHPSSMLWPAVKGFTLGWLIVALFLFAAGCGSEAVIGPKGEPGEQCSVQQVSNGAVISCPDGSVAFIKDGTTTEKKDCKK